MSLSGERVIAGPFILFDGAIILEALEADPKRNASCLLRTTFPRSHPSNGLGRAHPFTPPLHLHFKQTETFQILSGAMATIEGYATTPQLWTAKDGPQSIPPWCPHTFYPVLGPSAPAGPSAALPFAPAALAAADDGADTVMLMWANPVVDPASDMDTEFFVNILRYLSDNARAPDPLQVMLMMQGTASAPVVLPRVWVLGPLRWMVPYAMQATLAAVARVFGYTPLLRQYTPNFDEIYRMKKA